MTVTGTGFGPFSTVQALIGTGATVDAAVVNACLASASGTTLTCSVAVNTGSTAGLDGLQVTNGTAVSLPFESALTIAGPVIVSTSPASIATGAPTGTVPYVHGYRL